jgi:hypothetical protein
MPSVIELNAAYYVVDRVAQGYVPRLSSPFRTTGVQVRTDDSSVGRYVHPAFPLGIGWERIKRDSGRGMGGLRDSTCWTTLGPVTLGKLQETQTHAGADHFKKAVNFKADLWGLFEEDYGEDGQQIMSRKFGGSGDSWAGGGKVAGATSGTTIGSRGWDIVVHKGELFVLHNGDAAAAGTSAAEEVCYGLSASVDGATWTDAGLTDFPDSTSSNRYLPTAVTRRNNFDDDMGRLLSFGNVLLAAMFRHPDGTDGDGNIVVLSSTDSGDNWDADVTIPSGDGPKAFVDWYDMSLSRSPVLVTAEGVWSIDYTNDSFELIYALDGDPANGRWSVVGNDGALYVGLGSGSIIRLAITDSNVLAVINIGPPGDGLVAARQGHVNYMLRTPTEWLLVAYGGHASGKNASIFMIDTSVLLTDPETGKRFMPWHHMWQDATGNLDIVSMAYSAEDDATPRLHFAVEGTAASINYHIEEPFVHPNQSSTVKYQATSVLRLPDDDLGDPQTNATVLQALVDADDLSADTDDEYIALRYGLNGASDTTTTLGNFLSGTIAQSFGSGAGVAARRVGINLLFDRGSTTTNTPKMNEFELQAHHVLLDKKTWTFTVDIHATASGETSPSLAADTDIHETIISALEAIVESSTLVTFTAGGMSQVRVKVPNDSPPQFNLSVVDSNKNRRGYRTGWVTMRVDEGV